MKKIILLVSLFTRLCAAFDNYPIITFVNDTKYVYNVVPCDAGSEGRELQPEEEATFVSSHKNFYVYTKQNGSGIFYGINPNESRAITIRDMLDEIEIGKKYGFQKMWRD